MEGCASTVPIQIKINDHTLNDQKEIGLAFNKHFVAAAFRMEDVASTTSNYIPPVSQTPHFTLSHVPTSVVVEALLAINPKQYMGGDNLDPFSIKLSAHISNK